MKRTCICGASHIFDRKTKSINGKIVRCEACFEHEIVSELPKCREVTMRYLCLFGGRLLRSAVDIDDTVCIQNRIGQIVGRVV